MRLCWLQLPRPHLPRPGGSTNHTIKHKSGQHWDKGEATTCSLTEPGSWNQPGSIWVVIMSNFIRTKHKRYVKVFSFRPRFADFPPSYLMEQVLAWDKQQQQHENNKGNEKGIKIIHLLTPRFMNRVTNLATTSYNKNTVIVFYLKQRACLISLDARCMTFSANYLTYLFSSSSS